MRRITLIIAAITLMATIELSTLRPTLSLKPTKPGSSQIDRKYKLQMCLESFLETHIVNAVFHLEDTNGNNGV